MKKMRATTARMRAGLLVAAIVIALAGLGLAAYWRQADKLAPSPPQSSDTQFQAAMDAALAEAVGHMRMRVAAYRAQQKILAEMVAPEHLESPSDVAENYQLMQESIPVLKARMESALAVFQESEARLRALVMYRPAAEQDEILKAWAAVKKEQAEPYVAYFAAEARKIDSYQKLMEFYVMKQGHFSLDKDSGQIVFDNPDDQAQEQAYRQSLTDVSAP